MFLIQRGSGLASFSKKIAACSKYEYRDKIKNLFKKKCSAIEF